MTETGAAQAKEAYGKISAATADATDLIRKSCSTAVEGAQAYNDKLLAFAQANSKAAFDFAHKLLGVNSPSEFMQLSTEHARKQFEISERPDQRTGGACPEGHPCDHGAA